MAPNYKIQVRIKIVECAEEITKAPRPVEEGTFEFVLAAEQARSIDACEQALLQTNSAALRDAFAAHLSGVSRQHALEVAGCLEACQVKPYRVEGEIGRVTFDSYWVDARVAQGAAHCAFAVLHAQECYRTVGFKELALVYGTVEESYRQAADLINRVRHQPDATPARTLQHTTQQEGHRIARHLDQKAQAILGQHGFSAEGRLTAAAPDRPQQPLVQLPAQAVQKVLEACAPDVAWLPEMAANPVPYEAPDQSVHVCLDDVDVKRQKETRPGPPQEAQGQRKSVHNTIAHLVHRGASYLFNSVGVPQVLRLVLAFLLHNDLVGFNLIFLVDGQRTLYQSILSAFAWFGPLQIILDWYHLKKRCQEQLSLTLKGRSIRNQVLAQLLPCLWHGCLDRALVLLQAIQADQIKDPDALQQLIGYLERNRPYISCYSVRKRLGLPNSSNQGEKANDLIVSARQKHNGMSWSRKGSVALATVTTLVRNREHRGWFESQTVDFKLAA